MKDTLFFRQAELFLQILPFFKQEKEFALKGGTAINFFHRNLPRLSVDIDLTWLPISKRENALTDISQKLEQMSARIKKQFPIIEIIIKKQNRTNLIFGLLLRRRDVSVKIEPNLVMRGSVYPAENKQLSQSAVDEFGLSFNIQTLSFANLFGSKLCAALDRQHPRDFYDVNLLLQHEGITEEVRKSFLVYLISHPRPIAELLEPNPKEINLLFKQEFEGMTIEPISLQELIETQNYLTKNIKKSLTEDERNFLISFKSRHPDWKLLGIDSVEPLPAVQWKLLNLQKMSSAKHQEALTKLDRILNQ